MINVQNSQYNINFAQNNTKKKASATAQKSVALSSNVQKETTNNKAAKIVGAAIGSAASLMLVATAVAKGIPFVKKGKLNDLILKLGKEARNLKNKEIKTGFETFMTKALDKSQAAVNYYKTALNITSLKDVGFKKITDKIPFIGKGFQKITDIAENISVNMVKKSYTKTNKNFEKLYTAFNDANSILPKAEAKIFEKEVNSLRKNVINNFGTEETGLRLNKIKDSFEGIGEKIWDATYKNPKRFLKSKEAYSSCLAEQISVAQKSKLTENVNKLRSSISNNQKSDINNMKELLTNINSVLDPFADSTINAMKSVESKMKIFTKTNTSETREALLESIKNLNKLVPDKEIQEIFAKNIDNFKTPQNGQIQELLSKYKTVLPKKEYAKLEQTAQKAINSLDKSVDMETNKLFEKMRDLEIGSAPTDIVSMLTTVGAVGYGLGLAKNKDERISAALSYGIPAIGAITVSLVCTTSLIAAGPSLAIGLISGLAMNKIGSFADKVRKALSKESEQ